LKQYNGVWMPDDETHLCQWMEKRKAPVIDGFQTYQYHKYLAAKKYVKNWRTAIDVGAHIGQWSRVMAMDFDQLYSFEPVDKFAECWVRNLDNYDNALLHRTGLGNFKGHARIEHPTPGSNGNARISDAGELISIKTLDSFNLSHVDFIKIDCEGYEINVINGGLSLIKENRPCILVEQKKGNGSRYCEGDTRAVELLIELGAVLREEMSGDYILSWD